MRFRQNYVLLSMFVLVTLWQHQIAASRRKQSDSILEIINTHEIEQILAELRMNSSREDGGQFLIQNDLDEDFTKSPRADRYRQQHKEFELEMSYGDNQKDTSNRPRYLRDVLMKYNDSHLLDRPDNVPDIQELLRTDKLLKSSKNTRYITRKEYLKKDWCKTKPLVQRIREQGCLTKSFINRFCYGQCNSFYIPKNPKRRRTNPSSNGKFSQTDQLEDEDLTTAAFRSCGFCKPKKSTWITVILRCPSLVPQLRKKRVQRIKRCRCMAEPLN